jgi:hypothetical protein
MDIGNHLPEVLVSFDAIHVIRRTRYEEAGGSRHGSSPMRERDNPILPDPHHNATMRNVAPIIIGAVDAANRTDEFHVSLDGIDHLEGRAPSP